MNLYQQMTIKHQNEFNQFPMFFAYNDKQFAEGMKKLGLNQTDTDKVYRFNGVGFYRKSDSDKLKEMLGRHDKELTDAIESDESLDGFVYQMFYYELSNHEFVVTGDVDEALDAVGLTYSEVCNNEHLNNCLIKACFDIIEENANGANN